MERGTYKRGWARPKWRVNKGRRNKEREIQEVIDLIEADGTWGAVRLTPAAPRPGALLASLGGVVGLSAGFLRYRARRSGGAATE